MVVVLLRWLAVSGRSPWGVLAYAWNPLVAVEGAGSGHVDLVGALLLAAAALLLTKRRTLFATLAFALAVAVKFLPVVLAPLCWRRVRARDVMAAGALLLALYVPFRSAGLLPTVSLGADFARGVSMGRCSAALNTSCPPGCSWVWRSGLGVAVASWNRSLGCVEAPGRWAWPIAVTVAFAPSVYPWYLLWLTPFLDTRATLPLAVWTVTSLLTYVVWHPAFRHPDGTPAWILAIEYGSVVAAALAPRKKYAKMAQPASHDLAEISLTSACAHLQKQSNPATVPAESVTGIRTWHASSMTKPSRAGRRSTGPSVRLREGGRELVLDLVPGSRIAQSGSAGFPRDADLAEQLKRLAAALPAAFSFAASHVLGTSGRLAATCDTQESTLVLAGRRRSSRTLPPSRRRACTSTRPWRRSRSAPEESPVFATFARHASLPLSFFPIAFSFAGDAPVAVGDGQAPDRLLNLGEPQVAVGPVRDLAAGDGELRDRVGAVRRDPSQPSRASHPR